MFTSLFFPNLFSGLAWSHYVVSNGSLHSNPCRGPRNSLKLLPELRAHNSGVIYKLLFQNDLHTGPLLEHAFKIHLDTLHQSSCKFHHSYHNARYYGINIRFTILTHCNHQSINSCIVESAAWYVFVQPMLTLR